MMAYRIFHIYYFCCRCCCCCESLVLCPGPILTLVTQVRRVWGKCSFLRRSSCRFSCSHSQKSAEPKYQSAATLLPHQVSMQVASLDLRCSQVQNQTEHIWCTENGKCCWASSPNEFWGSEPTDAQYQSVRDASQVHRPQLHLLPCYCGSLNSSSCSFTITDAVTQLNLRWSVHGRVYWSSRLIIQWHS